MARLILLGFVAVVAFGQQPSSDGVRAFSQAAATGGASADIETFVRQALEDRLAAQNLPDGGLFRRSSRIAVLEDMPKAGLKISQEALPKRDGYEFYLISSAAAEASADTSGSPVYFIVVDRPTISADTATIWLGTDVVFPREPKVIKMCCCTGQGQFRRVEGRWTFVTWVGTICS